MNDKEERNMDATVGWMLGVMGVMVLYAICAVVGSAKGKN